MWFSCLLSLLISLDAMDLATAKDLCKTEVSVLGMALKGFYKKVTVTAPYECDITCRGKTKCQSFNFVIGEKSCELSARTNIDHSSQLQYKLQQLPPDYYLRYCGD